MTHFYEHVLVTGGAGFIGSQLLLKLIPRSRRITVIDDCSTSMRENVPTVEQITFIEASYVNEQLLERVLPSVTHIYHVACKNLVLSVDNMDEDFHVNCFGGYLLLKKAKELCPNLQRFVYTSTASVYGNADLFPTPESSFCTTTPYAASKLSLEHYCQVYDHMHNMPVVVLRLSNVYGPGQLTSNPYCGVVAKFFEMADQGRPFPIYGDGTQTRDYTYIDDALAALLLAGHHPATRGHVFNVGTGIETSVLQLAEMVSDISGRSMPRLTFHPQRRVDVVQRRCLDASLLQRTLNWEACTNLAHGLRKTDQWRKKGSRSL